MHIHLHVHVHAHIHTDTDTDTDADTDAETDTEIDANTSTQNKQGARVTMRRRFLFPRRPWAAWTYIHTHTTHIHTYVRTYAHACMHAYIVINMAPACKSERDREDSHGPCARITRTHRAV